MVRLQVQDGERRETLLDILKVLLEDGVEWLEVRTPTAYIRLGAVPDAPHAVESPSADGGARLDLPPSSPAPPASRLTPAVSSAPNRAAAAPATSTGAAPAARLAEGEHAVTAPFVGVFYRRPSPSEPPFVEVGARVSGADTVCLIETMKVFNSVPAGVDGVVVAIEVPDGELVEYGQLLLRVAAERRVE